MKANLLTLLLLIAVQAFAFNPPTEEEQIQAIGKILPTDHHSKACFSISKCFHPIPAPSPIDWLANVDEPGQTYEQFRKRNYPKPNEKKRRIYLQPIGVFQDHAPSIEDLKDYAELFFGMQFVILPTVRIDSEEIRSRVHPTQRHRQMYADDILRLLHRNKPKDAYAVLGLTMTDMFSGSRNNFVFGVASTSHRTAVFSFARNNPEFYNALWKPTYAPLVFKRSMRVMTHELGHLFGLMHCIHFACLMNGANHLQESDRQPLHLCPVCLRKLHHQVGFEIVPRYKALNGFFKSHQFQAEEEFTQTRMQEIELARISL